MAGWELPNDLDHTHDRGWVVTLLCDSPTETERIAQGKHRRRSRDYCSYTLRSIASPFDDNDGALWLLDPDRSTFGLASVIRYGPPRAPLRGLIRVRMVPNGAAWLILRLNDCFSASLGVKSMLPSYSQGNGPNRMSSLEGFTKRG
jgi:hypothetical protein